MLNTKRMELLSKKNDIDSLSSRFTGCSRAKIERIYDEVYRRLYENSSPVIQESDAARRIIFVLAKKETREMLDQEYGKPSSSDFREGVREQQWQSARAWESIRDFFKRLLPPGNDAPAIGAA